MDDDEFSFGTTEKEDEKAKMGPHLIHPATGEGKNVIAKR